MKTKFLLSALCLPTIFAACNSEEILVNNDVVSDMPANRAVVELNVNVGVDSRMTMENGAFAWEETDKIGSVLVDPATLWTVDATKTIGNNRWDYNDGSFSTQGTTVEGAWMFYFPYDPAVSSSRSGVKVTKSIQYQNYDPDGKLMAANDFRVSPIYFVNAAEGGADIDVRFNSVYSYGLIDATFPTDVVVDKVLIKAEGATKFNDKLLIKPASIAAQSALNYAKEINGKQEADVLSKSYGLQWTKGDASKNETWVPNALNAEYALQNWAANKEYNEETIQPIVTAESYIDYILVRCGEGVATSSKKFTTNVLLPADTYATTDVNKIDVYFYTDKGVYKYDKVASSTYNGANLLMKRGCTVQLHNVNKVAEVTTPAIALAPTTIAVANTNIDTDPYIIDNKDLVAVINSVTTTKEISPKLLGTITIDDAVASALEANAKVTKMNVALANIDVTCAAKNISKLFTAGKVTLKNGANVTFKGGQIKELLVEAGATATIEKNIGVDYAVTTVKGTLNLSNAIAGASLAGEYRSSIDVKGGVLNIGTAVANPAKVPTITTYLRTLESGEANINVKLNNPDNTPTLGLTSGTTEMNVTVNADVTSANAFVLQSTAKLTNNATLAVATNGGEIDNYGTLNVATNNVTINNYGIATIDESAANSYINQYDAEAEVEVTTNSGTIDAIIDGCETTVGTNTIDGEIIIANLAKLLVTTNNGDISFSAPEGFKATDFSDLDNTITKIIINEDFTYDYSTTPDQSALATLNAGVKKLQFAGDLTLRKDWTLNANSEVSFVGEKVMIQGKFTLSNARTMNFGVAEVKNGDDVIVPAVYTDAQIAQGTTITGLVNLNLLGTAQKTAEVWNSGVVDAHFNNEVVFNGDDHYKPAKADGWKGNPIK